MLAIALSRNGQLPEAGAVIAEAQALARRTGARREALDLWRLQGELDHARGAPATTASTPVREGLGLARAMGSRMQELRALVTLARLTPDDAAVATELDSVVAGFTEGLDTADLRDARALLGGG
jgi:hypothetical protein